MSAWLDPLRRSMLERPEPRQWFFRDDDAGWDDDRLLALIEVFVAAEVHLDLAAIPMAVSSTLGRQLQELVDQGHVSVHQHGFAHVNHELQGRRSEFGSSRPMSLQQNDLLNGRDLLAERMNGQIEPVFTPPWNRCSAQTAELLEAHDFQVLSADLSAPRRDVNGLHETPVAIDWARAFSRGGAAGLVGDLRTSHERHRAEPEQPAIGVMLHHAVMEEELVALRELLELLRTADGVVLSSISELHLSSPTPSSWITYSHSGA